jgi:hypothetical protein
MRLLVTTLSVLIFLDAMTTYFVIALGVGIEMNPMWRIFNTQPSVALVAWIPPVLHVVLVYELYKFSVKRGFSIAARVAYVLILLATIQRAVIIVHNLSVLFFHVNLLPIHVFSP